jgi:hypothetical protein
MVLHEWREVVETTPTGPKTVRQSYPVGESIIARGPSPAWFEPGRRIDYEIQSSYGLTLVPKPFWELWSAQNSDLVRNRVIFAAADAASTKAQVREFEKVPNSWAPIKPDDPVARGGKDRLAVERGP